MAKLNRSLIKQVVVAYQANSRQDTSHTKTRGNVSGGGKKPWRQKGTGRARAGSSRSPIWVGGGITFGPLKERTHAQRVPKKMSKLALAQILDILNQEKNITVVDSLSLKEPKTKLALELLKKHDLLGKKILLVTNTIEAELVLAARNLKDVSVKENRNISVMDVAFVEAVLIDSAAAKVRNLIKDTAEKKPAAKKPAPKTIKK